MFDHLGRATGYTLSMRHAFDADHISAVDKTTRKKWTAQLRPNTAAETGE